MMESVSLGFLIFALVALVFGISIHFVKERLIKKEAEKEVINKVENICLNILILNDIAWLTALILLFL